MAENTLIPQHKRLAMGESIGDSFDVETFAATSQKGSGNGARKDNRILKDSERTCPVEHGQGRSQANPDHGSYKDDG